MHEVYDISGRVCAILLIMNFRHPVILTLLAALILVAVGFYFVARESAVAPNGASVSWQTEGGYVAPTETPVAADTSSRSDAHVLTQTDPDTLAIPAPRATTTTAKKPSQSDDTFDYNALLAQMRHDTATTPAQQANKTYEELMSAFSYSPKTSAPAEKTKAPEQIALFAYGNAIGSRLQGFSAVNLNMTQTLTDQINHRANQQMGTAVRDLGLRYQSLGESILAIHDVLPSAIALHKTLGESYVNLGTALAHVPDATDDQAFIAAITAYNNKADVNTRALVSLASFFSSAGVAFEETDAGSVFSFRHN